jgi:hypothetical protein
MSVSRRQAHQNLSIEERELYDKTRSQVLRELSDADLASLTRLLRERRSRARTIANQQRREMRGKSSPTGTRAATRNDGTTRKGEALASALKRANSERSRRLARDKTPDQVALARKALRKKRASTPRSSIPKSRTAGKGMRNIARTKVDDLSRPMEVGRVTKFVAVAQAKKDARGEEE